MPTQAVTPSAVVMTSRIYMQETAIRRVATILPKITQPGATDPSHLGQVRIAILNLDLHFIAKSLVELAALAVWPFYK